MGATQTKTKYTTPMPICRYTGTEPSPQGKGWCAHAEKVGTRKKGNDGSMWHVAKDKNGRHSWKNRRPASKNNKIINPVTGKWVSRNGIIGKHILQSKWTITNEKRYRRVVQLWDWWSQCTDTQRRKVSRALGEEWDASLNDQVYKKYPIYIMSYEPVLEKAHSILHTR
mgnify:CR=1 FL=1|tara:strand:- start:318 stop:824 length:507 start_codon:yes stop_codon:yes gene_type:complete